MLFTCSVVSRQTVVTATITVDIFALQYSIIIALSGSSAC